MKEWLLFSMTVLSFCFSRISRIYAYLATSIYTELQTVHSYIAHAIYPKAEQSHWLLCCVVENYATDSLLKPDGLVSALHGLHLSQVQGKAAEENLFYNFHLFTYFILILPFLRGR